MSVPKPYRAHALACVCPYLKEPPSAYGCSSIRENRYIQTGFLDDDEGNGWFAQNILNERYHGFLEFLFRVNR